MSSLNLPQSQLSFRNILGLVLVALGVSLFFLVDAFVVPVIGLRLHNIDAINDRLVYQVVMLILTFVFLAVMFVLFRDKFRQFASLGDISAPVNPVPWLNIKADDNWRSVGLTFSVIISIATGLFMFFGGLEGDLSRVQGGFLGLAVLFALSNSFIEEAITRFGVVISLHDVLPNRMVALASGLIFGIPHFFGTPGGPLGSLMAGFMGWLLAKSMLETEGFFWAWFVHFLQDVIIFMVLASVAVG